MDDMIDVYFAGDFSNGEWRQDICFDLPTDGEVIFEEKVLRFPTTDARIAYVGPYFVICDSRDADCGLGKRDRQLVFELSKFRIRHADCIFAHVTRPSAYGTLVELGYAHALGKPIFLNFAPDHGAIDDHWFPAELAAQTCVLPIDRAWAAFRVFASNHFERTPQGLQFIEHLEMM